MAALWARRSPRADNLTLCSFLLHRIIFLLESRLIPSAFMKIALFVALTFAAVSLLQAQSVVPPSMSMVEAATIAQKAVEEMKLPPEYFVRLIVYHPKSNDENPERYVASFEPSFYPPKRFRFLNIYMDGTTSIKSED